VAQPAHVFAAAETLTAVRLGAEADPLENGAPEEHGAHGDMHRGPLLRLLVIDADRAVARMGEKEASESLDTAVREDYVPVEEERELALALHLRGVARARHRGGAALAAQSAALGEVVMQVYLALPRQRRERLGAYDLSRREHRQDVNRDQHPALSRRS